MPPIVFLAPTFQAARRAAAQHFDGATQDVLVFANTAAASQSWRGVLRDKQNIWQPRFFKLDEWFVEAATLACDIQLTSSEDRRFLLRAILPTLRGRLRVLHRLSGSNDLVRQLDLLIADLRHADQEDFQFGGDWGHDLQIIVAEYNRHQHESGATDSENAPRLWAQTCALESHSSGKMSANTTVVFDQILNPSPAQWYGISALASRSRSTLITIVASWIIAADNWNQVASQVQNTVLENVCNLWREQGATLQFCQAEIAPARRHAMHALLKHRAAPAPQNVTLTSAHTAREEISRIVDNLKNSVQSAADLNDAAIVLPDPASYVSVLEPELGARGLPFHIRRARPHSSYPLMARVLRLLSLHGSDWSLNEIADLFGDGLLQLCVEQSAARQSLDIHRLRNACFQANLENIRGEDDCLERLKNSSKNFDSSLEKDLRCLQRLRVAVEKVAASRTAFGWRESTFALLDLTLSHLWDEISPQSESARQQFTALLRAVDRVKARADLWLGKTWQQSDSRDASFWLDCLRLELESAKNKIEATENIGAALPIVSPFSLLQSVPRVVYFAGLSEGAWPAPGITGTLLSRHRNELAPLRAHRADATQMALYQLALCLGEADEVHLLHPNLEAGREQLRSPLLEDIAICWGELPEMKLSEWPTSRAQLLEKLAGWLKNENLSASQLSPFMREVLANLEIDFSHLENLLQINRERSSEEIIGAYDGALGKRGEEILRQLPGDWRKVNATSIKNYATCPLRYFFQNVLRLERSEAIRDELDAADAGTLIHRILERFAREYSPPLEMETIGAAWAKMQTVAREVVEAELSRPVLCEAELRRLIGNSSPAPAGVLGCTLLAETAQQQGQMEKPAFASPLLPIKQNENQTPPALADGVEVSFDFDIPTANLPFHVNGRMDRVLRSRDGQIVAVVDYKTQSPTRLPQFYNANWGLDFQLPLYLLATRHLWKNWTKTDNQSTPPPAFAAVFFALGPARWQNGLGENGTLGRNATKTGLGAISQPKATELEPPIFHAWLDESEKRIAFIGEVLIAAQFNLSFQDAVTAGCGYCDYRTLCRRDDALATRRLQTAHEKKMVSPTPIYVARPLLKILPRNKK